MATLQFLVDWNDDADFSDSNENISAYIMQANWSLGMREPYQLVADESTCELVLNNADQFFTPEGPSAIAGSILPHRRMKIISVHGGGTVDMWNGWIDHVEYEWQPGGTATGRGPIRIIGTGPQQMLQETNITLPTYYKNVGAGTIIRDVLAIVQVPPVASDIWYLSISGKSELSQTTVLADESAYSDIDDSDEILHENYAQFEEMTAWEVIAQLTEAERGRFYFARDGRATYRSQQTRFVNDPTLNNSGTITDTNGYRPSSLDYRFGEGVITSCRVEGAQRSIADTEETLWQLYGGFDIGAPGTVYQWAKLRRRDGKECTATGVRVADIHFYAGTADIRVDDRGAHQLITITNSSVTTTATLVGLTLVGIPIADNDGIAVEVQSNTFLGTYGRRNQLLLDLPAVSDYDNMRRIANGEVQIHKTPRGEITRMGWVMADDGTANAHIRNWSIGTVVYAAMDSLYHAQAYQIIGESHQWQVGNVHTCDFFLEFSYPINPYLLDEEGGAQ